MLLVNLSSCKKDEITQQNITNFLPGTSYIYTVEKAKWIRVDPNVYGVEILIPELDEKIFNRGAVQV